MSEHNSEVEVELDADANVGLPTDPGSPRTTVNRHDGHEEGCLNCTATRHGWSRSFSIPPDTLSILSYDILEELLELPTLKLRSHHLRVYVENPPRSGTWSKVRYWKDDGSLQSVLVKSFFQGRLGVGTADALDGGEDLRIDVRDGLDRDDALSTRSGMGLVGVGTSRGSRINLGSINGKPDWFKRRNASTRSLPFPTTPNGEEEEATAQATRPTTSRRQAFMFLIGLSSAPPNTTTTVMPDTQSVPTKEDEERALKKRGWLPPGLRQVASRRSMKSTNSTSTRNRLKQAALANPFFSPKERQAALAKAQATDAASTMAANTEPEAEEGESNPLIRDDNAANAAGEGSQAQGWTGKEPAKEKDDPEGKKKTRWLGLGSRKAEPKPQQTPPAAAAETPQAVAAA